ncbi:hypothetical protein [Sphingorhabdus sp.]|uniref:hypothetical protein n=1 Tax=Sphingorhabdus sp. TaxID=1902408 RepID=UPI00334179A8
MAYRVPNTGWAYFFFPMTVLGTDYYGRGTNREWPVGDGYNEFFVTEETTLLLTDFPELLNGPRASVTPYEFNEDGSGSAYLLFSHVTEEAFGQLIDEEVTFYDGSTTTITSAANVWPGQSFSYGGPYLPNRVTSVGKLIAVS